MIKLLFNIFLIYAIWQFVKMFFVLNKTHKHFNDRINDLDSRVEKKEKSFEKTKNKDGEGEYIDYEEIKKTFSSPEGAKLFVEATGIDTFAAAVGNLHGKYPVPKELDLALLAKVRESISCNISLHGGSGTPLHYFGEAAKIGVSKVNINSDMRYVFRKTLEKVLSDNPDEYAVVKLMPTVYEAVMVVVEEKINAFGSSGRAIV